MFLMEEEYNLSCLLVYGNWTAHSELVHTHNVNYLDSKQKGWPKQCHSKATNWEGGVLLLEAVCEAWRLALSKDRMPGVDLKQKAWRNLATSLTSLDKLTHARNPISFLNRQLLWPPDLWVLSWHRTSSGKGQDTRKHEQNLKSVANTIS